MTDDSKLALLSDLVDRFGEATVRVTGSSMLPSIWPGDMLRVRRRLVHEVQTGDIVVFKRHGRLVTHRVVAYAGHRLITRGDTARSPDAPVCDADLLGVVEFLSRDGNRRSAPRNPSIAGRLVAAMVRRSPRFRRILQRFGTVRPAISELGV